MMFYKPNGDRIEKDEFISIYSNYYYLDSPSDINVPGLSRCSEHVENEITEILRRGIQSKSDVVKILAWKIGKIKHRDSDTPPKSFVYSRDWENAALFEKNGQNTELIKVRLYSEKENFPIGKIATDIIKEKPTLEIYAKGNLQDAQEFLRILNAKEYDRIGTVYMITLLYFMSHGKYPIYDRFAMMALEAIKKGKKPELNKKVGVDYSELPSKDSKKKFLGIMTGPMHEYISLLDELFGDEWKNDRRIDQALWVYGHLFEKANKKKSTCC